MVKSGNDLNATLFPLEFTATPKLDVLHDSGREKEEGIDDREIKKKQISDHVLWTHNRVPPSPPRSIVNQEKAHARKPEGLPVKPHAQAYRTGTIEVREFQHEELKG